MKNFNSKFKKFSAVLCGVGIMCSGFALAGCGESDPHAGKIEVIGTETTTYVDTWEEAVKDLADGVTLKLHKDITLDDSFVVSNSITVDGMGKYTIKADKTWTGKYKNLVSLEEGDGTKTFNLKNITIDGNNTVRCVYADNNTLKFDGVTVTNGSRQDTNAAGVYITSDAKFEMHGGKIYNNNYSSDNTKKDDFDYKWSKDLWVGANAFCTIYSGEVENMFINANEWSGKADQGKTIMEGGKVTNVYVNYGGDETGKFGATFEYKAGQIDTLRVSKTTEGEFETVTPVAGTTYTGGTSYNA